MSHQAHVRRVSSAYWISRAIILFVYAFAIACIVILAIAFFLQLFNANQTAPFVDWTYRAAKRIMQPFRGIFPPLEGEQGSVFDVSMLFAIFMYGLLALGLHGLDRVDRPEDLVTPVRVDVAAGRGAGDRAGGRGDPRCSAGPATRGVRGHVAATGSICSFSGATERTPLTTQAAISGTENRSAREAGLERHVRARSARSPTRRSVPRPWGLGIIGGTAAGWAHHG